MQLSPLKKEKEEKKGAKKATTQQASKQFYCYPMGNGTENNHFCPFTPKGWACCYLQHFHSLRVHYAHAAANLNSGYSKYAKVARVHYYISRSADASVSVARVDLRERRVDLFSKRVIIFCW